MKQHLNLLYCFLCGGYDVDHDGYNCPPASQKRFHLPHVKRDNTHEYEGACMKAQHKTLPDGSRAAKGWIMTKQMEKGRFVLNKQAAWKQQNQRSGQDTWQVPPQQQQLRSPPQQANNMWQQPQGQYNPPMQYPPQGGQYMQQLQPAMYPPQQQQQAPYPPQQQWDSQQGS